MTRIEGSARMRALRRAPPLRSPKDRIYTLELVTRQIELHRRRLASALECADYMLSVQSREGRLWVSGESDSLSSLVVRVRLAAQFRGTILHKGIEV